MAIMGVALLGLAQLFVISVYNNMRGGEISRATFLAQQEINYLRSLTAAELDSFPSAARGEQADESIDLNGDGTTDYRRITQIQASGHSYAVKILIFPPSQVGIAMSTLVQSPSDYRVRALMNTIISR